MPVFDYILYWYLHFWLINKLIIYCVFVCLFVFTTITLAEDKVFITVLNQKPLQSNSNPTLQCYSTNGVATSMTYGRYLNTFATNLDRPSAPSKKTHYDKVAQFVTIPGFGVFYCKGETLGRMSSTVPTFYLRDDGKWPGFDKRFYQILTKLQNRWKSTQPFWVYTSTWPS